MFFCEMSKGEDAKVCVCFPGVMGRKETVQILQN